MAFHAAGSEACTIRGKVDGLDNVFVYETVFHLARDGVPYSSSEIASACCREKCLATKFRRPNCALVTCKCANPVPGLAVAKHRQFVVAGRNEKYTVLGRCTEVDFRNWSDMTRTYYGDAPGVSGI